MEESEESRGLTDFRTRWRDGSVPAEVDFRIYIYIRVYVCVMYVKDDARQRYSRREAKLRIGDSELDELA